jgi:UDP-glucose 4-epimerase
VKNILVTGAAGFVGMHTVRMLHNLGYSVRALDNKKNVDTSQWPIGVNFISQSLLEDDVSPHFEWADYVVHLAALAGMKQGIFNPYGSMQNNLKATEIVSLLCLRYNAGLFFSSTSEVYGLCPDVPLREDSTRILGGTGDNRWGYAESKSMSERLLLLDAKEHGLKVKIGRLFNVAGPGQSGEYGMVMPRFIHAAKNDKSLYVYGDGTQTRSFCHVSDTVRGICEVILKGKIGEVYNVGNPTEVSINNLASTVIRMSNSHSDVRYKEYEEVYPGYTEISRRVPDISKLKALGWSPEFSLGDIIRDLL